MLKPALRSRPAHRPSACWWRWTVLCGLPSAAAALSSAWLYQPRTTADVLMATGFSITAVGVFVATMPRPRHTARRVVRDAVVTVVAADPDPDGGTPSDTYELSAYGVSVLVRLRAEWKGQRLVPYVHIDHEADRPRLLLVEIDNHGETEHR